MNCKSKLKILCLHGYRQDAETFRDKMAAFRKSIKNFADLVFITAPHKIVGKDKNIDTSSEKLGNSWWFCDETEEFSAKTECKIAKGFDESLETISNGFENQGPFDGILGFSQGASMVSLLCGLKERQEFCHDFKFAVMISGFRSLTECHQYLYDKPIKIQSLHIIGETDVVIPKDLGNKLVSIFCDPTVIYHEGGHFMPTHSIVRNEYTTFFKIMLSQMS